MSFTGGSGFEINAPARHGQYDWEQIMAAGAAFKIIPRRTEAPRILRAGRGFIVVRQDTEQTVTPMDLGGGRVISKKKTEEFICERGSLAPQVTRVGRKHLVGLASRDPNGAMPRRSHLLGERDAKSRPLKTIGRDCATRRSEDPRRSISRAKLGPDRGGGG
jgi:sarcosine oxidase subunit alpha